MSQDQVYNRLWLWSKSCMPIPEVTLIVAPPVIPSVTDSQLGDDFYSVQLQAVNLEGQMMQTLVQFQPAKTLWQSGYGEITATTGFSLEEFPIKYPFSLSLDFTDTDQMVAHFTQYNQNMNVAEGPYTQTLSARVTSKGIQSINFIAGGYGKGSSAIFGKGTAFDFQAFIGGEISDLVADGVQLPQGRGNPVICGTEKYPQTEETANLLYRLDSLLATRMKVRAYVI